MPGQPGAIRESRVEAKNQPKAEARPRNPEVEKAWKTYAEAYEAWQRIINMSTASLVSGYVNAEDARVIALRKKALEKDVALYEYFAAFDKDQDEYEQHS